MIGDRTTAADERGLDGARRPGLAWRATAVFLAGIALAMPMARADAQSIDELNARIGDARAQAQALNAEIETKLLELAAARQEASAAAAREAELSEVLRRGQERAAELAGRVDAAQARLEAARARLDRALDALADRLVAIYKSATPDEAAILLDSRGYDDLATRADLLRRIQAADRALVERVRELRAEVADELAAVEAAKRRVDAFNARVEAARDQISAARAAAEARAAALSDARAAQVAALGDLQDRMAGWADQVQRLERISAAEAAEEVASWGGTGDWAIPEAIVMCESGGNYSALNPSSGAGGAYQILPSTWELYGGKGLPHEASPAEQDAIAAQIWADSGPGAWVCAG